MQITEVRVFPVDEDKLKAFVSIVIDDVFVVSDIKIIQGRNGRFLSMPSSRRRNGSFRDIAHPLNNETRRRFEERIIAEYREVVAAEGETAAPLRELDGATRKDPPAPKPAPPQTEQDDEDPSVSG